MDQQESFQGKDKPQPTPNTQRPHDFYQSAGIGRGSTISGPIPVSVSQTDRVIATIQGHRVELEDVGIKLAKVAYTYKTIALITKVIVIFLGAFIVTKEVANQILGFSNFGNIVIYAVAGLLIATLTGLETAFKWERKSAELGVLVASCRATTRKTASDLAKIPEIKTSPANDARKEVNKLLDVLDDALVDVQTKAAALGVDTTRYRVSAPQKWRSLPASNVRTD